MEPITLVAGSLAVVFLLLAVLQWRRAMDWEERARELEAKLRTLTEGEDESEAEEAEDEEEEEPEPKAEEKEPEEEPEEEKPKEEPAAREEEPPAEEEEEPVAAKPEAAAEPAAPEPEPAPPRRDPEPEPPPKRAPEPDPLRVEALKVVAEAYELARYLDFDAIVEKPNTYRVTVPITAANGNALRYLEAGMFACLKEVRIEEDEDTAILHVDMSKGPP
jgi:FtsZ-interacting cell division protein ZipA